MGEPWDRPNIPKMGNFSERILFESIGRCLNYWEQIEIGMSRLYTAFTADDLYQPEQNKVYGEDANFMQRASKLERAAQTHFCKHPSQEVEGEYSRLINLAIKYSARRNDITHAHVLPINFVMELTFEEHVKYSERTQWCLVPPHFSGKKFTSKNLPTYAFTSREINSFAATFFDIAQAFANLTLVIALTKWPPSRRIRPRPSALPYTVRDPRTLLRSKRPPLSSLL